MQGKATRLAPRPQPSGNTVASACFTPCWSSLSQSYAGMPSRSIAGAQFHIWRAFSSRVSSATSASRRCSVPNKDCPPPQIHRAGVFNLPSQPSSANDTPSQTCQAPCESPLVTTPVADTPVEERGTLVPGVQSWCMACSWKTRPILGCISGCDARIARNYGEGAATIRSTPAETESWGRVMGLSEEPQHRSHWQRAPG
eukprot:gene6735-biopygen7429